MQRRWKVLAVTAVAVFMGFLDVTIVNVAFPAIESDFSGTSRADLSWILNAYNIVFAALLVPAGRIADLTGRKRMFLIGVTGFVSASLLMLGVPVSPKDYFNEHPERDRRASARRPDDSGEVPQVERETGQRDERASTHLPVRLDILPGHLGFRWLSPAQA